MEDFPVTQGDLLALLLVLVAIWYVVDWASALGRRLRLPTRPLELLQEILPIGLGIGSMWIPGARPGVLAPYPELTLAAGFVLGMTAMKTWDWGAKLLVRLTRAAGGWLLRRVRGEGPTIGPPTGPGGIP